jgi:hypothetical protein
LSAERRGEELVRISLDDSEPAYARVAAMSELSARGEVGELTMLRRSRTPFVAAAAWLVSEEPDDPVDLGMSALAIPSAVERSAIFEVASAGLETATVAHALRRERSTSARRVLERSEPYQGGVVVYLVDERSGYARQDEDVFLIFTDGTFDIFRSDALGLVTISRDDVRSVFVH